MFSFFGVFGKTPFVSSAESCSVSNAPARQVSDCLPYRFTAGDWLLSQLAGKQSPPICSSPLTGCISPGPLPPPRKFHINAINIDLTISTHPMSTPLQHSLHLVRHTSSQSARIASGVLDWDKIRGPAAVHPRRASLRDHPHDWPGTGLGQRNSLEKPRKKSSAWWDILVM